MLNDGFSNKQLDQLKSVFATKADIPSIDQIRDVVKEEVRNEVASQLQPIQQTLNDFRREAREDSDELARTDAYHDRRLTRVEKHLDLKPLVAQ